MNAMIGLYIYKPISTYLGIYVMVLKTIDLQCLKIACICVCLQYLCEKTIERETLIKVVACMGVR